MPSPIALRLPASWASLDSSSGLALHTTCYQMGRTTQNHSQIYIDYVHTPWEHLPIIVFRAYLSQRNTQDTLLCPKMSKESSLYQLSRLKSKFLNWSPPYSESQKLPSPILPYYLPLSFSYLRSLAPLSTWIAYYNSWSPFVFPFSTLQET